MGLASDALYFASHPKQLSNIIQWKLFHRPVHERNTNNETETTKICFTYLDQTGRSFSPVIKELHPELLLPVCVFYLILRGLDTIEDDTSIPLRTKEPLLRNFKDFLDQDGWTFTGNRPEEKDRDLLIHFDNVVTEFKIIKPSYQAIIKDITNQMGNGMADYARKAASNDAGIHTIKEYNLYCWYVAGIVGEGMTKLFVEAGLGDVSMIKNTHLYKSMGLFLQKNNIIRDVCEDFNDGRRFWPKEIWSKHVDHFEDLFKPENLELALHCSSEMILNALGHVIECLVYLEGLHEQSVFNFCAIPQTMALATLELCFRNPAMFKRNIKIFKADAFQLMLESSQDLLAVHKVFHRYVQKIQQKNSPKDPNFSNINAICEQIKTYTETYLLQNVEIADSTTGKPSSVIKRQVQESRSNNLRIVLILIMISIFVLGVAWLVQVYYRPD